jgi:hypothetical protein
MNFWLGSGYGDCVVNTTGCVVIFGSCAIMTAFDWQFIAAATEWKKEVEAKRSNRKTRSPDKTQNLTDLSIIRVDIQPTQAQCHISMHVYER